MARASDARIADRHLPSGLAVADGVVQAADGGGDDRNAAGQRLQRREPQPFFPARLHADIGRAVVIGQRAEWRDGIAGNDVRLDAERHARDREARDDRRSSAEDGPDARRAARIPTARSTVSASFSGATRLLKNTIGPSSGSPSRARTSCLDSVDGRKMSRSTP